MLKSIANWSRKAELRANIKLVLHDIKLPMNVNSMSDIVLANTFANHIAISSGYGDRSLEIEDIAQGIIGCSVAEIILFDFDVDAQKVSLYVKSMMDFYTKLEEQADSLERNKLIAAYWNASIKAGIAKDAKIIAGNYIANKNRYDMEQKIRGLRLRIEVLEI